MGTVWGSLQKKTSENHEMSLIHTKAAKEATAGTWKAGMGGGCKLLLKSVHGKGRLELEAAV